MTYKLLKQGVKRIADGACIPPSDGNMDWREYQKWLALGNTPDPQDPDPAPIDFSDVDNVEKALKALGLVVAAWNGKTPAQLKAAFKTAWDSLP
jgi:hypothetical protein